MLNFGSVRLSLSVRISLAFQSWEYYFSLTTNQSYKSAAAAISRAEQRLRCRKDVNMNCPGLRFNITSFLGSCMKNDRLKLKKNMYVTIMSPSRVWFPPLSYSLMALLLRLAAPSAPPRRSSGGRALPRVVLPESISSECPPIPPRSVSLFSLHGHSAFPLFLWNLV